jgi:hypothetical protein
MKRVLIPTALVVAALALWACGGTTFCAPMILKGVGPYHCSIHPSMVGTMVADGENSSL